MSWPHRIGAIIQVLTGQIKPPHSVPDTCSKLATCALFLLSAGSILQRKESDRWLDYTPDGNQIIEPVTLDALRAH